MAVEIKEKAADISLQVTEAIRGRASIADTLRAILTVQREVLLLIDSRTVGYLVRQVEDTWVMRKMVMRLAFHGASCGIHWLPILGYAMQIAPRGTDDEPIMICNALNVYTEKVATGYPGHCLDFPARRGTVEQYQQRFIAGAQAVAELIQVLAGQMPAAAMAATQILIRLEDAANDIIGGIVASQMYAEEVIKMPLLLVEIFLYLARKGSLSPTHVLPAFTGRLPGRLAAPHILGVAPWTCGYVTAYCLACAESNPEPAPSTVRHLVNLLYRLAGIVRREESEWRQLAASQQLRIIWDKSIKAGVDPSGVMIAEQHGKLAGLTEQYPWPFDGPGEVSTVIVPIVPVAIPHTGWDTSADVLTGTVTYILKGSPGKNFIKLKYTLASLLIQVCHHCRHSIARLGAVDPMIVDAIGLTPQLLTELTHETEKLLKRYPQVFPTLNDWKVVTPSSTISIWVPLLQFRLIEYADEPIQVSVDWSRRKMTISADPVRRDHPAVPLLPGSALARIRITYEEMALKDRAHNAVRTALFEQIGEDGMETLRGNGRIHAFVDYNLELIDLDLRLFSGVIRDAPICLAFVCLGQFTQTDPVRSLSIGPPVCVDCAADAIWQVVRALGTAAAAAEWRVKGGQGAFADVFLEGIIAGLSGGKELTGDEIINPKYLPQLGWICAYLLLQRVINICYGPPLSVYEFFFYRLSTAERVLFEEGFSLVLSLSAVLQTISVKEMCCVLRKTVTSVMLRQ